MRYQMLCLPYENNLEGRPAL